MLLDEIENFEIFRPKCNFSRAVVHSIAKLTTDISPVFPYLHAELGAWDYDPRNQVILLKLTDGKWITLQPHEIAIRGARDKEESQALLAWIKGQINDIWERRELIEPRYQSQAGLKILEILKLLPRTNCRACGYQTCMAYVTALREGETSLENCPPLWEEKYRDKREKLASYLESYGWRPLDA